MSNVSNSRMLKKFEIVPIAKDGAFLKLPKMVNVPRRFSHTKTAETLKRIETGCSLPAAKEFLHGNDGKSFSRAGHPADFDAQWRNLDKRRSRFIPIGILIGIMFTIFYIHVSCFILLIFSDTLSCFLPVRIRKISGAGQFADDPLPSEE